MSGLKILKHKSGDLGFPCTPVLDGVGHMSLAPDQAV